MPTLLTALVKANATVRIETQSTTKNDYGYLVETYTTLADDVPVSFTLSGGQRDGRFESQLNSLSGRVSSSSSYIATPNCRIYFKTGTLAGVYARVMSVEKHGPGNSSGLITDTWYSAMWNQVTET